MNRKRLKQLWTLTLLMIILAWGCKAEEAPASSIRDTSDIEETAFWECFPLPDDADTIPIAEGIDLGFATGMIEPEIFDVYAAWLSEEGWRRQAPSEARVTLPHQRWRKDGVELLIEIRGLDERGRTLVWIQLEEMR